MSIIIESNYVPETITDKVRLHAKLSGTPTDRPPFICPGGMMNGVVTDIMDTTGDSWPTAHHDAKAIARLSVATREHAGFENVGAPFCMTVEAEGMGATIDMGSRQTEPRVSSYAIARLGDIDRLPAFDAREGRAAVVSDAVKLMCADAPDAPVFANLTGPISLATSVVDPLGFYRAMRTDPSAAHELLRLSTRTAIAFGDALVDAGADVVCIADPSGTGELIGRRNFETFALPYINEITQHFVARGVPSIVHICGNVGSLGSVLAEIEAPALSVDSCVAMRTLRGLAPGHRIMGNVSTYLLEYGKPSSLAAVARNRVAGGVDIISPACGVGARTPIANIRAIAEVVAATTTRVADSRSKAAPVA